MKPLALFTSPRLVTCILARSIHSSKLLHTRLSLWLSLPRPLARPRSLRILRFLVAMTNRRFLIEWIVFHTNEVTTLPFYPPNDHNKSHNTDLVASR